MTATKKIEKLTPEQEAMIPVHLEKWLKIGLCTDVIDFAKAKEALALCYTTQGLPAPSKVYYAKGPHDAYKIYKSIRPDGDVNGFMNGNIFGSQDSSWISFYSYFNDVCGIDLSTINGLVEYAKEGGWAWVDEDEAIIQERPMLIKFNDQNRLHCEDGPAIEYMDGTMVYAWHGVRLDRKRWNWISDKKSLTATEALKQDNLELRRVACEILGWVHILKELKSVVIDQDEDPMIGTLLEVDIPDVGTEKFLHVLCGTNREFAIPVPPDMKTALEANCWTYGFEQGELRDLEFRT
jgi:hypothetical protein